MRLYNMRSIRRTPLAFLALALLASAVTVAQNPTPTPAPAAEGPAANSANSAKSANSAQPPVTATAVVADKRGPVKGLAANSFTLTIDGKSQAIRSVTPAQDVPLSLGLLIDVSPTRNDARNDAHDDALEAESKSSEAFLNTVLSRNDKAFIMQFGRTAELLQDLTALHALLEAGLKQVGTVAPQTDEEAKADAGDRAQKDSGNSGDPNTNGNGGTTPGRSSGSNGQYGRNPNGRNGNNPNGNGTGNGNANRARRGTVLYDALFLASNDVLARQKGRHVLVVVTDGIDRHSKESLREALEAMQRADTVVYAIYRKGDARNSGFSNNAGGNDPYDPNNSYDPYDPYGRGGYGRGGYPGGGGSDGTYADPDGRKILTRLCGETGGRMFELKGKGSLDTLYGEIADEIRGGYQLTFTPGDDAIKPGYHKLQLTVGSPGVKKDGVQIRDGYFAGPPPSK